jgi:hypothetical protein
LKNIYRTAMTSPIEQAKTTGINFDLFSKLWNDIIVNIYNKFILNNAKSISKILSIGKFYHKGYWLNRKESGKYF